VFGRRKLPGKLRPALEKAERVIAWARVADEPDQVVVVTTLGLWLPGRARLGWHQIHKATWSGSRLTVIPSTPVDVADATNAAPAYTVMADDTPVTFALADPGDVPIEVRKRVTGSVVHTAHYPFASGGVRVVGRRVAGVDGLQWHVRYDPGTDSTDASVVTATAELVAEAIESRKPS
jgi:hypothetical protein